MRVNKTFESTSILSAIEKRPKKTMIGIGETLSGISGSITETTLKKLGFAD